MFFTHVDSERATQFVRQCQSANFTSNETAALAQLKAWASRSTISNPMVSMGAFNGISEKIIHSLHNAVEAIETPTQLQNFVANPLAIIFEKWAIIEFCSLSQLRNMCQILGENWMNVLDSIAVSEDLMDWEDAQRHVEQSLTHMRVDPDMLKASCTMAQACSALKLKSVSWSSWFYPPNDEHILAQQLMYMDTQLAQLSGWPTGCLGLFGRLDLELDAWGATSNAAGEFYRWNVVNGAVGNTSSGVRVYHHRTWEVLAHEWAHAVDFMVARHQNENVSEWMFSNHSSRVQQMLHDVYTRHDHTACAWLNHLKTLDIEDEAYMDMLNRMDGKPLNNFWGDFIAHDINSYYNTFPEQLAYLMTQASHVLGIDRSFFGIGSPQNRIDARHVLPQIFALPEFTNALKNAQKAYERCVLEYKVAQKRQESASTVANLPTIG